MGPPDHPPTNSFVRGARKVYNPLGFGSGYNFVLFFIFGGALLGFTFSRLQYIDFYGRFCGPGFSTTNRAAPGEYFYYRQPTHERVGIIIHLATILPASLLVFFQFVPAIRHNVILVHRINGYVVLILALVNIPRILMATRHAFGGEIATQYGVSVTSILFLGGLAMAYINIKRLQIEQHRAWMLRAWFYVGASRTSLGIVL